MSGETFGALLRLHRITAGLSQNQCARQAGVDPAYVNRLERELPGTNTGKPCQPTRGVVLALANALLLTEGQTDRFLFAAGLATCADWQTRAIRAETALATVKQAFDDAIDETIVSEPISIRRAM